MLSAIATMSLLATAQSATGEVPAPRAAADRVSCRSSIETGSILQKRLICRTFSAWNNPIADRRDPGDFTYEEPLILATPSADQIISTGLVDWDKLSPLALRGRLPYAQLVPLVGTLIRKDGCRIAGRNPRTFDIAVRFAVRVAPGGRATQVVVSDTGCSELNSLVGLIIFARSKRADIEPEVSGTRWYASAMNFTLR